MIGFGILIALKTSQNAQLVILSINDLNSNLFKSYSFYNFLIIIVCII